MIVRGSGFEWHKRLFEVMLEGGGPFRPCAVYLEHQEVRAVAFLPPTTNEQRFRSIVAASMLPYTNTTSVDSFEFVVRSQVFSDRYDLGETEALLAIRSTGGCVIRPYGFDDTGSVFWRDEQTAAQADGLLPAVIDVAAGRKDDATYPLPQILQYLAADGFAVIQT